MLCAVCCVCVDNTIILYVLYYTSYCTLCWSYTPEQLNLIAFLFFSQILRYNKYFKNTKVGPNRSKRFLGISNKAVYEGRSEREGNCPKKIPKKIFLNLFGPTFTNKYIYIRFVVRRNVIIGKIQLHTVLFDINISEILFFNTKT